MALLGRHPRKNMQCWWPRVHYQEPVHFLSGLGYKNTTLEHDNSALRCQMCILALKMVKNGQFWCISEVPPPRDSNLNFSDMFQNVLSRRALGWGHQISVNKRANDGPPHHRETQSILNQHEDTILSQQSYFQKYL